MRTILLMLSISILAGCAVRNNGQEVQIQGLWSDAFEERIWYIKDSVGYFLHFSPFTKWEIDGDIMKIMDSEQLGMNEYRIVEQTKDSLKLAHLNDPIQYFEFHKIDLENIKDMQGLKKVRLKEFECMGNQECMLGDIVIDFSTRDVVLDIAGAGDSTYCILGENEVNLLYYIFNRVQLGGFKPEYFSNNVGSVYYELQTEFIDSSKDFSLTTDSGAVGPVHLNNFISVVWAVSYLSCSQNDKLANRILH